jgi:drug/metabolite transporter (DMT)-like permease
VTRFGAVSRRRHAGLFVLLAAVWGTAFMVTEVGLRTVPPTLLAAVRFDVATLVLAGYLALGDVRWRPARRDWYPLVAGGALLVGVHHAFLFAGQQYVPSAVASVLLGLIPIVTPALMRVTAADERLSPVTGVGVLVGFAGVAVIADPDVSNLLVDVRGVALVFASALAFALGAVATYGRETTLSLPAEQAWMMLVGSASLHVASAVLREPVPTVWPVEAVVAVLYLAVVAGVGGFVLYFVLLDALGPVEMSLLEYVIPVFAAFSGWLALGQSLSGTTVAGFGLILVGFLLIKGRTVRAELRRRGARGDAPPPADD